MSANKNGATYRSRREIHVCRNTSYMTLTISILRPSASMIRQKHTDTRFDKAFFDTGNICFISTDLLSQLGLRQFFLFPGIANQLSHHVGIGFSTKLFPFSGFLPHRTSCPERRPYCECQDYLLA